MKILVCAWRHWTAGRRFRSLLLNAPKMGHEIFGLATDKVADQGLTIATFNELGAEAFPKGNWRRQLGLLNPDVIFAEYPLHTLEKDVIDWANKQGKPVLYNNHQPYIVHAHDFPDPAWTHVYYLVSSQQKAIEATTAPRENNRPPWSEGHCFVLGASDLDFVTEEVDITEVRERLGVEAGQPLVGLLPTTPEFSDLDELSGLVAKCQGAGWQVIIHPHPLERRVQNSEGAPTSGPLASSDLVWDGFYVYGHKGLTAQFWSHIQGMGARFIADYVPGRICGVEFHRCESFELILAADVLIGCCDPFFEAYALSKRYTLLGSILSWAMKKPAHKEILDPDFESQDNFTKVSQILGWGNDLEQDPVFVEKWFFKLDGLWWKRALALAEQLVGERA